MLGFAALAAGPLAALPLVISPAVEQEDTPRVIAASAPLASLPHAGGGLSEAESAPSTFPIWLYGGTDDMLRIEAGDTARKVSFYVGQTADYTAGLTGKVSGDFTVYYSLDGGSATAMTTPTVTEKSSANMPGWYDVLIDETGMVTLADLAWEQEVALKVTVTGGFVAPLKYIVSKPVGSRGRYIAQGGDTSAITFPASASSTNTDYVGDSVEPLSGSAVGDLIPITTYNGTSKAAATARAWRDGNPANTDVFRLWKGAQPTTKEEVSQQIDADAPSVTIVSDATEGSEPTVPPASDASIQAKVDWLMHLSKVKQTEGSGTRTVYAEDGTTPIATATDSDNGTTATRGALS